MEKQLLYKSVKNSILKCFCSSSEPLDIAECQLMFISEGISFPGMMKKSHLTYFCPESSLILVVEQSYERSYF